MAPGPRAAAQRGERAPPRPAGLLWPLSSLCGALVGSSPMWLPGCPEGQAVGRLPAKAGGPLSAKTLVNEPRHPAFYFLAASSRIYNLRFICSFLVLRLLCFVTLGCDLPEAPFRLTRVVKKCQEHTACTDASSGLCLLLSSFTLVLLYFSSSVLFSFSTLPLCLKTSLRW